MTKGFVTRFVILCASGAAAACAAQAGPARSASSRPEDLRIRIEDASRRYRQHLEAALGREPRDTTWADAREQEIAHATASLAPGTRLERVACLTNMCRVVLRHDDESAQRGLAVLITQQRTFQHDIFYARDGLTTTLYMMREGRQLPSPND
jgi:hypothetical protein